MKNFIKLIGIIALIAVIGFTFASCKPAAEPTEATYKSVGSDGNTYELVIKDSAAKAAYKPKAGDTYVLTITFPDKTKKISSGTVAGGSVDSGFTLKPTGSETTFTVTVSNEKMTAILGPIEDINETVAAVSTADDRVVITGTVNTDKLTKDAYFSYSSSVAIVTLSDKKVSIALGTPTSKETEPATNWFKVAASLNIFQIWGFTTQDQKYDLKGVEKNNAGGDFRLVWADNKMTVSQTDKALDWDDGNGNKYDISWVNNFTLEKGWNYLYYAQTVSGKNVTFTGSATPVTTPLSSNFEWKVVSN